METKLLLILIHLPVFAAAVYACIRHHTLTKELKVLSWFLITTGTLQFISLILWLFHQNNLFVSHLLVPLRILFLLLIYREILKKYIPPFLFSAAIIGFMVYSLINSLVMEPVDSINSMAMTVESVLLIILSLSTYILLFDKQVVRQLTIPVVSADWINRGVFLYYSSSLMLMHFGVQVIRLLNAEWNRYIWIAHGIFTVILYYCFWRALWNSKIR